MCAEYLNKGRAVLVEGRLKQDRWEDENGNKRSKLKIVALTVQFLSGRGDAQGNKDALYDDSGVPPMDNSGGAPPDSQAPF